MIIVPGVPFVSLCEHHLLAFTGTATLAYVPAPGARIVGLSKLARLAREYAARPQVQERLGDQIVQAIARNLNTAGAACIIRSTHTCMTIRGVRAAGAAMVTSHLTGEFRENAAMRAEFLQLAAERPDPHSLGLM
jgi:GTP cyclohydrolase I